MSAEYDIRPSREADGPSLHRCLDGVARERQGLAMTAAPPAPAVTAFRQQLVANGGIDRIAVAPDGEVIGWIDIQRVPWEGMRHGGSLGMGVHKDWRGRGIGRALLRAALSAAAAAGIRRVELEVFVANTAAIALYESAGFTTEGRKRAARRLDGAEDDILMMARLSADEVPSTEPHSARAAG